LRHPAIIPVARVARSVNVRAAIYFGYHRVSGGRLWGRYAALVREDAARRHPDINLRLLSTTLAHATAHVPYYRDLGIALDPDGPEETLRAFPLLSKTLIRDHADALLADDLDVARSFTTSSGGSTGEPITITQDQAFWEWSVAVNMLHSRWGGRELGEPEILIWGSERDLQDGRESLRFRVANALTRRTMVNAYRLGPAEMRSLVASLNDDPPARIVGYAVALYELAGFIEREGLALRPQRSITVTADTLRDHMRERIERVFGCRVMNRYGSRELGDVAGQCDLVQGLHVFPWANYVETVDDTGTPVGPGEEGEIVVTSLINRAMPLIRYRIGDRGILAPEGEGCSCGRPGQVLERLTGRSSDMFRRRDGTLVDPGVFMGILEAQPWVGRFQLRQRDFDDLLVQIEAAATRDQGCLEEIERTARHALGPSCAVTFEFPSHIEESASGKYRYAICELAA
jgi:phenylacetate-CoA ligase